MVPTISPELEASGLHTSSAFKDLNSAAQVKIKPLVKHVISRELQLYFDHVTTAICGSDESMRKASLLSISQEPGLQQLLPYFVCFVRVQVAENLRNLRKLLGCMQLVSAMLANPFFQVDRYLHQLLPSVLTCLVGKRLCQSPDEDHWSLRDYSAELVMNICDRYANEYTSLQPRITKTLSDALRQHSKPVTTHYGAVVGLSSLGKEVIEPLLLSIIPKYCLVLDEELSNISTKSKQRVYELYKMYGSLMYAALVSILDLSPSEISVLKLSADEAYAGPEESGAGGQNAGGAFGETVLSSNIDKTEPAEATEKVAKGELNAKEFIVMPPGKSSARISVTILSELDEEQMNKLKKLIPNVESQFPAIKNELHTASLPFSYGSTRTD